MVEVSPVAAQPKESLASREHKRSPAGHAGGQAVESSRSAQTRAVESSGRFGEQELKTGRRSLGGW